MNKAIASLLLLVTLSVAGCLGDSPTTDSVAEPAPVALPNELVAPTLHAEVLLGEGSGEPNVAVAPDGTIYTVPINDVYRSMDGGATFELAYRGLNGGGDGDLAIGPDGRLHWLGLGGSEGPIPYQQSDDLGNTWTDAVDVSNETGRDREWIVARDDEATVYSVWRGVRERESVIDVTTSFDGGATWGDLVRVSDDAIGGPLAVGPVSGQLYQAQATFSTNTMSGDASIRFAKSSDHGANWTTSTVLEPTQSAQVGLIGFPFAIFPVVDVDAAGNLYLVYAVDQGMIPGAPKTAARFGVYLQTSADEGESWSEPLLLSSPDHSAIMPWVAAGADGRIAVAWYENTVGLPHDNAPDVWNVNLLEMINATGDAQSVQVQLNEGPVHVGSICTSGTGCLLTAGDRSLLDFIEVALTPDGHPVVAWASTPHPYRWPAFEVNIFSRAVAEGTPLQ